jgi:thiamine kinase-like enzyme
LRNFGIENIPEILEVQYELGLIIYRWIDGREASPDSRSMDELLKFCITLKEISKSGESFQNSVDSVFSFKELESQISNRIHELAYTFPYLEVTELCHRLKERLENCNKYSKNTFFTNKTFSVSDLGTHNMITSKGIYYFIDFEFFGLDSIAKMVGDFILHPRNIFNQKNISRFVSTIVEKFDWDADDLIEILPLLTLKWSLIAYLRTLKEHSLKGINRVDYTVIDKSLGTQYLMYFDRSGHVGSNNSIKTFSMFRGIVD